MRQNAEQTLAELFATSPSSFLCLELIISRLLHLVLHLFSHNCLHNISRASNSSDYSAIMPSKKTMKIKAPAALRHHYIKPEAFLTRNKQYTDLAVAGFVFHPPKFDLIRPPPYKSLTNKGIASNAPLNAPIEPARLLLLQRPSTDTNFADLWEVPWGDSELTDQTVLHSVERVMLEETGLHLKRFLKQIGNGEESETSQGSSVRLSFEIEITEMAVLDNTGKCTCPALNDVHIEVDPAQHQDFVWVTEEDVLDEIFTLVTPQQKDVILHAFQLRQETEEEVRAQAVRAERARKKAYYDEMSAPRAAKGDDKVKDTKEDESEVGFGGILVDKLRRKSHLKKRVL